MFITIDGHSGAGKTTQLRILAKHLNLEMVDYLKISETLTNVASLAQTGNEDSEQRNYRRLMASIQAMHSISPTDCIFDHFWHQFYPLYLSSPSNFTKTIRFLRTGIALNNRPEPDVSILIDVPPHIALSRSIKRDAHLNIEVNQEDISDDQTRNAFWTILETEIPYFYRVNGDQSITDVTQSIISHLPKLEK